MKIFIFLYNKLKLLYTIFTNYFSNDYDLFYVIENANWSIKHDGISLTNNLLTIKGCTTITWRGIRNSIVHFGYVNLFLLPSKLPCVHNSNKIIVTWFHISGNENLKLLSDAIKIVDFWHTSCFLTKNKMVKLGIPEHKIIVIPLGVNLNKFCLRSKAYVQAFKKKLGIPEDKIIIGSFQKDGHGWNEGNDPKLIKGPDIFCEVVEKLSLRYELFIILTGPARGYVKNRLKKSGIPYIHHILDDPEDTSSYYSIIDMYLMCSREEGGPKSVLEAMASGVPLVATAVGMVPDIIINGQNGFLCKIEDTDSIINSAENIINDSCKVKKLIRNGVDTVKKYSWGNISEKYCRELYKKLV